MQKSALFSFLHNFSFVLLGVLLFYLYTTFTGFKDSYKYIYSGQVKVEDIWNAIQYGVLPTFFIE